jgi:hypothetical protein
MSCVVDPWNTSTLGERAVGEDERAVAGDSRLAGFEAAAKTAATSSGVARAYGSSALPGSVIRGSARVWDGSSQ